MMGGDHNLNHMDLRCNFYKDEFGDQCFDVNEHITMKLEYNRTNIYIYGHKYFHCKYLLINIPIDEIDKYNRFESMDEVIEYTKQKNKGKEPKARTLKPETEFWGHCSNIQAWVENEYDLRVIESDFALGIIETIISGLIPVPKQFREFLIDCVQSLDEHYSTLSTDIKLKAMLSKSSDYKNTHSLEYWTFNAQKAILNRWDFLGDYIFDEKYFPEEFIEASSFFSYLRNNYFRQKRAEKERIVEERKRHKKFIRQRGYWERKLWRDGENTRLQHRLLLRRIRNNVEPVVSDISGYLPYLFATGKFHKVGRFHVLYEEDVTYIRDDDGEYMKTDATGKILERHL